METGTDIDISSAVKNGILYLEDPIDRVNNFFDTIDRLTNVHFFVGMETALFHAYK